MKALVFIFIVFGFIAIGPLLGLLFFQASLSLSLAIKLGFTQLPHTYNFEFLPIMVLFAYAFGGLLALICGIYTAICAINQVDFRMWVGCCIATALPILGVLQHLASGHFYVVESFSTYTMLLIPSATFLILAFITKMLLSKTQFALTSPPKTLQRTA